jgi:hypothetical protein
MRRLCGLSVTLALAVMATGLAFGQADQGAVVGLVQDASGAVVPNAQVTLINTDNGLQLQAQTDNSGNYAFSPVKIGNYSVTVTAQGFEKTTQEHIQLHVQDRIAINIQLKLGAATETVTITDAPPLLQTEDGSSGQVMDTQTINNTPLNGRNWVFIAQLTAGVDPASGSRGQNSGDFNANGQRAEQNNFIMDGVDNNVNVVDFFNGASFVVRPPPDALAEFKVQTGAYSAEFGHSAGAVVNASIKSGTNQIHGDVWEYVRNDAFDIRQYFDGSNPVPKYRQNQFGATLGLPLIKNHLFFFGDAEANRIIFAETHSGLTVPTAQMRTGDFSELLSNDSTLTSGNPIQLYAPNPTNAGSTQIANNRLDLSGIPIDSVAQGLLNLYPAPNVGPAHKVVNNYTIQSNAIDNTFQWDTRMDWNISPKDLAFARYSYNHEPVSHTPPLGDILDGGGFEDTGSLALLGENFAFSETHVFTPTLTNEFRFGYNYGHFEGLQANGNTDIAPTVGLGGIPFAPGNGGLPAVTVGGLSSFGAPTFYVTNELENVYQILDNVSKIQGNHSLKAGVDFQRVRSSTEQPTEPRGAYTFNGVYTSRPGMSNTGFGAADFLTNNMNGAAISNLFNTDDVRWNRAVYVQDDWKASQRLTLNLGVRYDYTQPYLERHDAQASVVLTGPLQASNSTAEYRIPKSQQGLTLPNAFTRLLAADNISLVYTNNRQLIDWQHLNFAPRFGFAYKATDRLAIHGGYGIFFGGLESTGYYPNLGENFPFEFNSGFQAPSCNVNGSCPNNGFTLETGFTNAIAAGLLNAIQQPQLRGSDAVAKTSYSEQFNLTAEYGFNANLVGSVAYAGAVSRHLETFPNPNGQLALAPNSFVGYTDTNGDVINPLLPFPHFSGFSYTAYNGSSSYNSLQTKLERRFSNGLSFLASYTWSHSLDDAPTPLGSTADPGYRGTNIVPIGEDYGNSPFDVRHRFTLNGNLDLPFGHGRKFINHSGPLDYIAGGWSTSLVFRAQTGEPITVGTNNLTSPSGAGAHAVRIHDPFASGGSAPANNPGIDCATRTRTVQNWYNPCAYTNPKADDIGYTNSFYPNAQNPQQIPNTVSGAAALAYLGNPRGNGNGPGYERIDASLFKSFKTFREQNFQFRVDAFNLLNTPGYGDPSNTGISTDGGQIQGARTFQSNTPDSRFFQFSAKYNF